MMIRRSLLLFAMVCSTAMPGQDVLGEDATDDATIGIIIEFIGDKDKDTRALGLQQIREEAKGVAATERFASLLSSLPAEVQIELLSALADRGDMAARPAVLGRLKDGETPVRLAALRALGPLGEAEDVALMVQRIASGTSEEQRVARASLVQMCGLPINPAIVAELKRATPELRIKLMDVLASRRAVDSVSAIVPYVADGDTAVRKAAMAALGVLAGAEHLGDMLPGVLAAKPGSEREAAEKAILLVCNRIKTPGDRATLLLAAFAGYGEDDKTALLSTLGRVGGAESLKLVEAAMADSNPQRREAGVQALCNWPDASVADRLLELVKAAKTEQHRRMALRALTRVAALPDARSAAERLSLLETAMSLSTTDSERNYVLKRAKAIRTIESLRFVEPYLAKPEHAQDACEAVVELAHHRALREPNKAEFDKALDVVIAICKDADLVDRAQRYKKGQTRLLPSPGATGDASK